MIVIAWINRVLLTVLSIMTGVVKLAQMPEEMEIFRQAGFSDPLILGFGVVQLVDENSQNGTFVRIRGEKELGHGDYLFLGRNLVRVEVTA